MIKKYEVFYSEEDKEWVAITDAFGGRISHLDSTPQRALEGLMSILPDVIEIAINEPTK